MPSNIVKTDRKELISVLQSSLYVGAKPESIGMVIDYCAAANLDPMQKPVHIVPMNTKNPVTGNYEWRDVIMPGIGLYRIQADRSKAMAGISEPTFGKGVTEEFVNKGGNKVSATYPEWCKVVVKKLVGSHIVEFVAKEYWIENYATDSGKSSAPNKMWGKRPRGQIAKCAEAQALRKAFPEIGQAPTAEEMEGKTIDISTDNYSVVSDNEAIATKQETVSLPIYLKENFDKNSTSWMRSVKSGRRTPQDIINMVESRFTLSEDQKKTINGYKRVVEQCNQTQGDNKDAWLDDYEATSASIGEQK